jgi:hypothetical protein
MFVSATIHKGQWIMSVSNNRRQGFFSFRSSAMHVVITVGRQAFGTTEHLASTLVPYWFSHLCWPSHHISWLYHLRSSLCHHVFWLGHRIPWWSSHIVN